MTRNKAAIIKDANAQLQEWVRQGMAPEKQAERAALWLQAARPYIFVWAEEVGGIQNLTEKAEALKVFFKQGVATLDEGDRAAFKDGLCDALQVSKAAWNDHMKVSAPAKKKKGDEDDEGEPVYTTGGWLFEHLLGLEYDQERDETYLAVRFPDGHIEDRLSKVLIQGRVVKPIPPNNIIRKRVILLPSELADLKDEEQLLFAIKAHNHRYFDFGADETFEQLCMIYPFFTYLATQFRTLAYLRALGDYGTGKSRLLKTLGPICHQPIMTNAGSSASSLFRILDMFGGSTLVLDEADFSQSDEASMIAKILNGGNEKGQPILRSEKNADGNFDAAAFDVFGPKIIGMRKDFQDQATASRCLTKEMMPIQPHPRIPLDLPPVEVYERECLGIRNALHTYRMHNMQKDAQVDLGSVDRAMDARTGQVTLSLLTVMTSERGREMVRQYLAAVTEERRGERYSTFTARVLEGLMRAWAWGPVSERPEDADRVYLKDIALATNEIVDEQNRQMGEGDDGDGDDEKGGGFKAKSRKIASVMKNFLNLKTIRATDGTEQYKGTSYVNMTVEADRVRGLCERWGVSWLDSGSRPRSEQVTVDLNKPSKADQVFRAEREKWYGHPDGQMGLDGAK